MVKNLSETKNKIEALLFATNEGFNVADLVLKVSANKETVEKAIKELRKDHSTKGGAIEVIEERGKWRMKVKTEVAPVLKDLLPVEIPSQVLKTLAIIAWKHPAKQSEIIKIRGNKAYTHIKELRELEYITSQKKGRTKILRLGPKFYKYFNLSKQDAKHLIRVNEENIHKEQNPINIQDNQPNTEVKENA